MSGSILLVEDDASIRETLVLLLEEGGFKVQCAINGQEALEHLRRAPELPTLILLDIMMPVMNGYQFRDEQRKDGRLASIPTVILSADTDVHLKTARTGVKEYLKKPVSIEALFKFAEKYCHGARIAPPSVKSA